GRRRLPPPPHPGLGRRHLHRRPRHAGVVPGPGPCLPPARLDPQRGPPSRLRAGPSRLGAPPPPGPPPLPERRLPHLRLPLLPRGLNNRGRGEARAPPRTRASLFGKI